MPPLKPSEAAASNELGSQSERSGRSTPDPARGRAGRWPRGFAPRGGLGLGRGGEVLLRGAAWIWGGVCRGLDAGGLGLGRSHWRAAFLLRRRPGVGVQE